MFDLRLDERDLPLSFGQPGVEKNFRQVTFFQLLNVTEVYIILIEWTLKVVFSNQLLLYLGKNAKHHSCLSESDEQNINEKEN